MLSFTHGNWRKINLVTVTVVDGNNVPQEQVLVYVYQGDQITEAAGGTDSNGQTTFRLPDGGYRFKVIEEGIDYWSDGCAVPACSSGAIAIDDPVTVMVVNPDNTPAEGVTVWAYEGEENTNISYVTNSNGQAYFGLPNGSYRFKAMLDGEIFWSGDINHCTVPGCAITQIMLGTPPNTTEEPPEPLQHAWYLYDGDGNMVKGIVNTTTTYYPGSHFNLEVNGTTEKAQKFYFAGGVTIAVRTVVGEEDSLQWILSDHLSSASVTANADGTWNSRIQYTAFGEVRASSGLTATKYRYTGQLAQDVLGLDYYVAR